MTKPVPSYPSIHAPDRRSNFKAIEQNETNRQEMKGIDRSVPDCLSVDSISLSIICLLAHLQAIICTHKDHYANTPSIHTTASLLFSFNTNQQIANKEPAKTTAFPLKPQLDIQSITCTKE